VNLRRWRRGHIFGILSDPNLSTTTEQQEESIGIQIVLSEPDPERPNRRARKLIFKTNKNAYE
jgi:hypothetical protein